MKRLWRVLETFLVILLVIAAGAAGAAWYYARSSLPTYGAQLQAPGLDAEVTVYRDQYAVPHIFASTEHDLFFAQGWVQAEDRLWEMDLSRRAVAGRLSEILGADYVNADHFLRTIGFYRAAEASRPSYPPEVLAVAQAYADGVNAFIAQAGGKLPIEFSVQGYQPEPWAVTDSGAIGKYMSWILGGNMETELFNLAAVDKFGAAKAAELFAVYPEDGPVMMEVPYAGFQSGAGVIPGLGTQEGEIDVAGAAGLDDAASAASNVATSAGLGLDLSAIASLLDIAGQARLGLGADDSLGLGSNNWVVSGKHTASGKPFLANDMHLEIKQPSIWYQNHLVCEAAGYNVTGVMFPGLPGVIVGHNERVAWGVTNTGPDVQDLYIEKPNPDNPHEFEYNGKWEPATVYEESIRVKGQTDPVVREVVVTRHGPVITEVMAALAAEDEAEKAGSEAAAGEAAGEGTEGSLQGGAPGGQGAPAPPLPPLALRWTALDPSCELAAVLGFDKAGNWDEFKTALESFKAPCQNFVFADVDGNIAYRSNGLIPIRSEAAVAAGNGLLPVPGWNDLYEWRGFIPWDGLPSLSNPEAGIVVTANHRVTSDNYPYYVSAAWASPYRAASIWQELRDRSGLQPADMQAIQNDIKNLQASRLGPTLAAAIEPFIEDFSPMEKAAWEVLDSWARDNPKDDAGQAGPTIFHTFYFQALKATFADELGDDLFGQYLGSGGSPTNTLDGMILAGQSRWFDDVTTTGATESMANILVKAFQATVALLSEKVGGQPGSWEWGKVHTVTFDHPMGSVSLLRPFVNVGPYPTSGSGVTPCAKGFSAEAALEGSFSVESGAPWRFVADLSNLDACYDVMAVGESGQPFSPHYADQIEMWLAGTYKPMLYGRGEIQSSPDIEVTVLSPGV